MRWQIPDFEGTLGKKTAINAQKILIKYTIYKNDKLYGTVDIFERNYNFSLGDPKIDFGLEAIEVSGISIVKTKGELSSGGEADVSFTINNVSYLISSRLIGMSETLKIAESIITQIQ